MATSNLQGPQSSLFLAQLLVWSALCEIDMDKEKCNYLQGLEISNEDRIWLAFLASRRDTYIIPSANCIGYMLNTRVEQGIDPNRDFAYSRNDNTCFRSSTAKLFNVLMRETLTQIVVTFHGGMVMKDSSLFS